MFHKKLFNDTNYQKDIIATIQVNIVVQHRICDLKLNVANEIPVVFHNGSKHDYHFLIKELANESEDPFECIGENNGIYKRFSVPIKKEVINRYFNRKN